MPLRRDGGATLWHFGNVLERCVERQNGPVADESWKFRVKQTRSRGMTEEVVIVRGEWLFGQLATWDQPAELLVGDTVKRIDCVYETDQGERVPGKAVLHLYGVTVDDVPIGAVVTGPLP